MLKRVEIDAGVKTMTTNMLSILDGAPWGWLSNCGIEGKGDWAKRGSPFLFSACKEPKDKGRVTACFFCYEIALSNYERDWIQTR